MSPELEHRFFTTEPPGKPFLLDLLLQHPIDFGKFCLTFILSLDSF